MRLEVVLVITVLMAGCATTQGHEGAGNAAGATSDATADMSAENIRRTPLFDALHGWLWWIGTDELKQVLTEK